MENISLIPLAIGIAIGLFISVYVGRGSFLNVSKDKENQAKFWVSFAILTVIALASLLSVDMNVVEKLNFLIAEALGLIIGFLITKN